MNSKLKTIIGLLVFVALIAAASFAYNALSKITVPDIDLVVNDNTNTQVELENMQTKSVDTAVESEKTQVESEEESIKALDFTVVDANGNEVKLSELFGKPIVLNFWASWCPPCKSEMPEFNKVYEEMGDEIIFMMVDLVDGQRETKAIGEKYVADQNFTFPVYYDVNGEAGYIYEISSIPTTIFIDKDGYAITGVQGSINEETLRNAIEMIR